MSHILTETAEIKIQSLLITVH